MDNNFEVSAESLDAINALFSEDGNTIDKIEPMKVDNQEVSEVDITEENLINTAENDESNEVEEQPVVVEQPKKRRGRPVGSKSTKIKIINPETITTTQNSLIESTHTTSSVTTNKVENNSNTITTSSNKVNDEECWNYIYNNYSEKNNEELINELNKSYNHHMDEKDIEMFVNKLKNELDLRVKNNNLTHSDYEKIVNNRLTKKTKFSSWVASLTF